MVSPVDLDNLSSVASALQRFEKDFDLRGVVVGDVWLWPLVRARLIGRCRKDAAGPSYVDDVTTNDGTFRRILARAGKYRREVFQAGAHAIHNATNWLPSSCCDVVALTRSRRRKRCGDVWVDTVVDPVAESLQELGAVVQFWGWEPCVYQSVLSHRVRMIGSVLNSSVTAGRFRRRFVRSAGEPQWFDAVRRFAHETFQLSIEWAHFAQLLRNIQDMRRVFEGYLRRSRPGLIITDCWYNKTMAAATLAAQSLGIRSCDVQHGIQEHVHPCFHQWSAIAPEGFLNPFPAALWVWGERTARLYLGHSLVEHVLVGGNAFLNRQILVHRRKAILVDQSCLTIGYSVARPLSPLMEDLRATIEHSPKAWKWIFRTHPSDRHGPELLRRLKESLAGYNIDLDSGQDVSFFEYLSLIDVHAVHGSTCALEAMTTGMATIVTERRRGQSFASWIRSGVLVGAFDPIEFPQAVQHALTIDPVEVKRAGAEIFAPQSATEHASKELAALAGLSNFVV